jgi:hypothetical protein
MFEFVTIRMHFQQLNQQAVQNLHQGPISDKTVTRNRKLNTDTNDHHNLNK